MEDELHKRIISQDDAITAVSKAIRRTRAGLKDPKRPAGLVHLPRPLGRREDRAVQGARGVPVRRRGFADPARHVRVHGEAHGQPADRLAPGYVGYEEGGQLTEAVRRKPFSVILFDEIEKAHPDVFNTLLQILEDGRLTDSQGHHVDFKNTIIIMTSNLGTRDIQKGPGIGFAAQPDERCTYERMKDKVMDELKRSFRPEFLNRIDEIIVFHSLSQEDVKRIVDLMIKRVREQLKAKDLEIELTEAAKVAARREGLRPRARRPAAPPDDPAARRGPALREAPVQGVPRGSDDHRRRPRRRDRVRGRRHPAGGPAGRARRVAGVA